MLSARMLVLYARKTFDLRNGISVISNSDMILELMETHLQRLTAIRKQSSRIIPPTTTGLRFERLGLCDNLLVTTPSP